MVIAGYIGQFESLLGEIVSTELRIAVSIAIVLGALFAAGFVIPRAVAQSRQLTASWTRARFGDTVFNGVERVDRVVPLSLVLTVVVRAVQLLLIFSTALALLVVWGFADLAYSIAQLAGRALPVITQIVITAVVIVAAYLANDLLQDLVSDFTTGNSRVTAHQEQILTRVLQVAIILAVAIAALSIWDIDLGGLLVGAGFLGIIVGLAARQTLGSLIAGFVLMFSRPFEIGDWIAIGDNEGIVTKITIMNTHLRNFDGEHVVIPNDNVADRAITNRSRDGKLRVHVEVGIDYDSDPEHAQRVALEAIETVSSVAGNPKPQVFPVGFQDSAVLLDIRFWISPPTPQLRWRATAAVVERVKERFTTESITIPFPQRTVSHRSADSRPDTDRPVPIGSADPVEKN